jgi:hypothetical protein
VAAAHVDRVRRRVILVERRVAGEPGARIATLEQVVAAKPLREYDEEWGKFRKKDDFVAMVYYGFVPYKQK